MNEVLKKQQFMANFAKIRNAARAEKFDAAKREVEVKDIFLAGPYVDVMLPKENEKNCETEAKSIRYSLYHDLTSMGHNVYLGEDAELRNIGEKNYGKLSNAVLYERHYIKEHIDALIVLPSSPGSFCEIGDWVSDRDICQNMLMIVDRKYKDEVSYMNDGVVKFAIHNHASVIWHAYSDYSAIFDCSKQFLDEIAAQQRVDRLYGR